MEYPDFATLYKTIEDELRQKTRQESRSQSGKGILHLGRAKQTEHQDYINVESTRGQ
jgi:hypothetical protein